MPGKLKRKPSVDSPVGQGPQKQQKLSEEDSSEGDFDSTKKDFSEEEPSEEEPSEEKPSKAKVSEAIIPKVCTISFSKTDIKEIPNEIKIVTRGFRSIGCTVVRLNIDSNGFESRLKQRLVGRKPWIIYITAHGSEDGNHQLVLFSHEAAGTGNSYQWSEFRAIVESAQCDVLVIVECCHAGLATLSRDRASNYAKEMITSVGWSQLSYGRMALALEQAIADWQRESSTRTAQSLYELLKNATMNLRNEEINRGHRIMNDLRAQRDKRRDDIKESQKSQLILVEKTKKLQEQLESEVQRMKMLEEERDSFDAKMRIGNQKLAAIKHGYPQPNYAKRHSGSKAWNCQRRRADFTV